MVAPQLPHLPLVSSSESQSEVIPSPKIKPSQPPNMTSTTVTSAMSIQNFLRRCRSGPGLHSSYLHTASRLPAPGNGPAPWRILPPGKISSLETCWARVPTANAGQLPVLPEEDAPPMEPEEDLTPAAENPDLPGQVLEVRPQNLATAVV